MLTRWKHTLAYVIVVIGLVVALAVSFSADHRTFSADHRDITRNCRSGQRSWDTLAAVVQTAYESRTLAVDPATLPADTRKLLAALEPLLKAAAGSGQQTERAVLAQLGPRPTC